MAIDDGRGGAQRISCGRSGFGICRNSAHTLSAGLAGRRILSRLGKAIGAMRTLCVFRACSAEELALYRLEKQVVLSGETRVYLSAS
jgi:hypothetical protein